MASLDDDHFKLFATWLETEISKFGESVTAKAANERQRRQMNRLVGLEKRFRLDLQRIKHGAVGRWMYRRFITFICDEQKNILDARPFFRERQEVFAAKISKALKARDYKALYRFRVNYRFILFALEQSKREKWVAKSFPQTGTLRSLANEITALRKEIVTINLPLAINRAQLFYSRTPRSHIARMDFVGIATDGLMSGIDKYTPHKKSGVDTKQFRSTAIGRMGGNFIEEYSETLLHFYPADKRKLYRANKITGRNAGQIDFDKLAQGVNDVAKMGEDGEIKVVENPTTPDEIANLMAAASTVSSDSSLPSDPDAPEPIERFAAPEATRPDVMVENGNAMRALAAALPILSILQLKILRLKGVRI